MAIGLGIHGEPGIDETGIPTADGLAELLVEKLLAEVPEGVDAIRGARVVPILNGLGSLKYEEMFVVYRRIAQLLIEVGIEIVDPHVGEYCTSFDMAGTSLTLLWLDETLEALWQTAVDTPAYRRGSVAPQERSDAASSADVADVIEPGDEASRSAAQTVLAAVRTIAETVDAHVDELGRLDAIAGDGDHGIGMQRGSHAAARRRGKGGGCRSRRPHDARASGRGVGRQGGRHIRRAVGRHPERGRREAGRRGSPRRRSRGRRRGRRVARRHGLRQGRGRRQDARRRARAVHLDTDPGRRRGSEPHRRLAECRGCRHPRRDRDRRPAPRMGRARMHGQNSVGTPDPGAISLALIVTAVGGLLADRSTPKENAHA